MASMRDGLGGEEISPSGVELSGTNATYVHPYFLGSVTSEDQISGANVYSDGVVHGENVYGDTTVSGATVKGTTISGTSIKCTTLSGTNFVNNEGEVQSTLLSSAASLVYGAKVQAGSLTLGTSAGSAWANFGVAFTNPPIVVAGLGSGVISRAAAGAGSALIYVNDISAGSAHIICEIGSGAVGFTDGPVLNWIAVGV